MIPRTLVAGVCLGGMLVTACQTRTPPPEPDAPIFKPIDPSEVQALFSAPGASRYEGVLPCADCAGVRTELTLLTDPATGEPQVYELKETHQGSMSTDGEKTTTSRGRWSIVPGTASSPAVYRLESNGSTSPRSFEKVGDEELRPLDEAGKPVAADAAHRLRKVPIAPLLTFPAPTGANASGPPVPAGGNIPAAMVTDLASGWPVVLHVGQRMTARLAADRSAGGRWSLRKGSDGGVVSVAGEPVYEPGDRAGTEVFTLTAVKPGQISLTFDYRKGSAAEADRTVSYPVTVQ